MEGFPEAHSAAQIGLKLRQSSSLNLLCAEITAVRQHIWRGFLFCYLKKKIKPRGGEKTTVRAMGENRGFDWSSQFGLPSSVCDVAHFSFSFSISPLFCVWIQDLPHTTITGVLLHAWLAWLSAFEFPDVPSGDNGSYYL